RPVMLVLPEGLNNADRSFLDSTILAIRRAMETVSDELTVCIDGDVASDVHSTVVPVEQSVLRDLSFKAIHCRVRMNGRDAAICPDHYIRRLSEDVSPIARAEERIRNQTEALRDLEIPIHF